jgi:hypothetical protein
MKKTARSESGYSLIELLVAASTGIIVLSGLFAMFNLSAKESARTTQRADANGRAKPVMQQLMTDLHSACTGPRFAPVVAGSTGTELRFQSASGGGVAPTPQKHVVTLDDGTLTEAVYNATGGANPSWIYSSTPSSTRSLLAGVREPGGSEGPTFSYWAATGGVIDSTPLLVPLSATDAARAVQVRVAMEVEPSSSPINDENTSVTVKDAAVFRFSPFAEDPTKISGPCA